MDTATSPMQLVYEKPETLTDTTMHYCPGCGHGVVHRVLMEVVKEMGIQSKTIGVAPVGCSVFAYNYMDVDMQEAPHGRASAVATGIKRVLPDKYVFSVPGRRRLGGNRNERVDSYGEPWRKYFNAFHQQRHLRNDGGTNGADDDSWPGDFHIAVRTEFRPYGISVEDHGTCRAIAGAYYVTRQSVHTAAAVRKLKKAIEASFKYQPLKKGTCFIEVVSNCPSGWKMTPVEANVWMEKNMFPLYPIGDLKVPKQN